MPGCLLGTTSNACMLVEPSSTYLPLTTAKPALQRWTQGRLLAEHGDFHLYDGGQEFALKVVRNQLACLGVYLGSGGDATPLHFPSLMLEYDASGRRLRISSSKSMGVTAYLMSYVLAKPLHSSPRESFYVELLSCAAKTFASPSFKRCC